MKKFFILLVLISLIFIGCGSNSKVNKEANAESASQQQVIYVKVHAVSTTDFSKSISLPGILKPRDEVMISADISGTVEGINVDIGSKVEKDDLLCKIDDTVYKLQYNKALTALNTEKIRFEDIEKNYQRNKKLYEVEAISQMQFESQESQYKISKENLSRVQFDFELAQENLLNTEIRTPISGLVSLKNISRGETATPGKVIFAVVATDSMYVEAGVSEEYINLISKGQEVQIKVDTLNNQMYAGIVTNVGPVPNNATKTYPVKILVDNPEQKLKSGMFASIEIVTDEHKNTLAVPKNSVLSENGRKYVFVEDNGRARKKYVKLGFANEDYYEVLDGLQENVRVVVVGNNKLKDGSKIEIR